MEVTDSTTELVPSRPWLGSSITDICKGKGRWCFAVSPVIPAKYHHVLYEIPVKKDKPPRPHESSQPQCWDDDHVRMPYSENNLFPMVQGEVEVVKSRWDLICKSLSKPITSSRELESAISAYKSSLPKCLALHYFFEEVLDEDESEYFFTKVLPEMVKLALRLPEILPGNIPLLKQNYNKSISLSQLQIACLLANAFFCTFPWNKKIAATYPGADFIRLFIAYGKPRNQQAVSEKFKCLCNYFRRITQKDPVGVVTFERKFIPRNKMPRWDKLDSNLGNTRVHITSEGTIEDDGLGFLQVDFANKNVGGGVLGYGCVQEEIRFVLCPELIISRLFVEQLGNNEALIITGAERYSDYSGYGETFVWAGNHVDKTPFDAYGRRKTSICVIDATQFNTIDEQFRSSSVLRELNKAYVGFQSREKDSIAPVATGNWGCGAFRGSKKLKSLIQLMACSAANRDLVYYSFGEEEIRDQFYNMYLFLANNRITVGKLWNYLCLFATAGLKEDQLFSFIQQAFFDNKRLPSIADYFKQTIKDKKQSDEVTSRPSTSGEKTKSTSEEKTKDNISTERKKKERVNNAVLGDLDDLYAEDTNDNDVSIASDDIIPNSQPDEESKTDKRLTVKKSKLSPDEVRKRSPKTDVMKMLSLLDGECETSCKSSDEVRTVKSLDNIVVKDNNIVIKDNNSTNTSQSSSKSSQEKSRELFEEKMDVECGNVETGVSSSVRNSRFSVVKETQVTKRKITDYFIKK